MPNTDFTSLIYTSRAVMPLSVDALRILRQTAWNLNAIDGVTGMLIVTENSYIQLIEGSDTAIDALMERLNRDRRHTDIAVLDRRVVTQRNCPDLPMALLRLHGVTDRRALLAAALPGAMDPAMRARLIVLASALTIED